MKRSISTVMAVLGLAFLSANPAEAQLVNFPNYAVPSAYGMPSSIVVATYGRGMNDNSGKQNAYGVGYVRTGIADRVGVAVAAGMIDFDPDAEYTFGGSVAVDLLGADATTQISLQGGFGYFSPVEDVSTTSLPIGVALKGQVPGDGTSIGWWIMPRLDIQRASAFGISNTNTELGASGGIGITTSSGFGVHAAVDLLAVDNSPWFLGVGAHYAIN